MGWATQHIERLKQGETVVCRVFGRSMTGKVEHGSTVTIEPLGDHDLQVGDIVLCKVRGNQYLHLVKALRESQVQIGNNRGGINGWTPRTQIFGICTGVER